MRRAGWLTLDAARHLRPESPVLRRILLHPQADRIPHLSIVAGADSLVESLEAAGIDVLLDDRGERPGVQFTDSELIGCPVRLTISKRSLAAGGVEANLRSELDGGREIVPMADVVTWVNSRVEVGAL